MCNQLNMKLGTISNWDQILNKRSGNGSFSLFCNLCLLPSRAYINYNVFFSSLFLIQFKLSEKNCMIVLTWYLKRRHSLKQIIIITNILVSNGPLIKCIIAHKAMKKGNAQNFDASFISKLFVFLIFFVFAKIPKAYFR